MYPHRTHLQTPCTLHIFTATLTSQSSQSLTSLLQDIMKFTPAILALSAVVALVQAAPASLPDAVANSVDPFVGLSVEARAPINGLMKRGLSFHLPVIPFPKIPADISADVKAVKAAVASLVADVKVHLTAEVVEAVQAYVAAIVKIDAKIEGNESSWPMIDLLLVNCSL